MKGSSLLSIILTEHSNSPSVESLLDTLQQMNIADCEIILINDAAEEATTRLLRKRAKKSSSGKLRYEEFPVAHGRSHALNRGLHLACGTLIWAPRKADRLNPQLLRECIRKIWKHPASFWILDRKLPKDLEGWLHELEIGSLPSDNQFLFNRNAIPAGELYFSETLENYAASELAWRILQQKSYEQTDAFFVLDNNESQPNAETRQEFLFSMLRETSDPKKRLRLIDTLRSLDLSAQKEQGDSQLDRAWQLMEQDVRQSLDLVNGILRQQPHHLEALGLKIRLLEKLRRYVEATELKHQVQKLRMTPQEENKSPAQPTLFENYSGPELHDTPAESNGKKIDEPGSDEEKVVKGKEHQQASNATGAQEVMAKQALDEEKILEEQTADPPPEIKISIIIPTTGAGKHYLQECLIQLGSVVDSSEAELIIIDNASIDDTFAYLEQLQEDKFLNLRVLTNSCNAGFAASINQGLKIARGTYRLIMHNDLLLQDGALQEMTALLDQHPYIGAAGPLVDKCDHPLQTTPPSSHSARSIRTDRIDSCCMLLRQTAGVHFTEAYGLAFYEDADLCRNLQASGYEIHIATRAQALHHHRATTDPMGLNLEPEFRWKNQDIFNARWNCSPDLQLPEHADLETRLTRIPLPVNPTNPSGYWLDQIETLFSNEVKTEIRTSSLGKETLLHLIRILLATDKRDFLRETETRVEGEVIPADLLQDLIRYYFHENIYSRCRLYLSQANASGPVFDLYRLRLSIEEKEIDDSVELLARMMEEYSCHPDLFRMAGAIHRMLGNEGEAKSFLALADQIHPNIEGERDEEVFEIKY